MYYRTRITNYCLPFLYFHSLRSHLACRNITVSIHRRVIGVRAAPMPYNIDNTSGVQTKRQGRGGERGEKDKGRKERRERSTEKRATRRIGRGNYVFRESTELHSIEELWIGALPRCRCEERGPFQSPPHPGYIFHR